MSNIYSWKFPKVEGSNVGSLQDVAQVVHWEYHTINESGTRAREYGTVVLGDPDPDNFTPWSDITQATLIAWCEAELDVPVMQQRLTQDIMKQENPPVHDLTVPES